MESPTHSRLPPPVFLFDLPTAQSDCPLCNLPLEILCHLFNFIPSSDHYTLRQVSIHFYHTVHNVYSSKERLVIRTTTNSHDKNLFSGTIAVSLAQSSAFIIKAKSVVLRADFDMAKGEQIRRHVILFRHSTSLSQLVIGQMYSSRGANLSCIASLISQFTVQRLVMIKLVFYSASNFVSTISYNPIIMAIHTINLRTSSLKHFSVYARCPNTSTILFESDQFEGRAFLPQLEELYVGMDAFNRDNLFGNELNNIKRLGFNQPELEKIFKMMRMVVPDQARQVTHLSIRDHDGNSHVLSDEQNDLIREMFPSAIVNG